LLSVQHGIIQEVLASQRLLSFLAALRLLHDGVMLNSATWCGKFTGDHPAALDSPRGLGSDWYLCTTKGIIWGRGKI